MDNKIKALARPARVYWMGWTLAFATPNTTNAKKKVLAKVQSFYKPFDQNSLNDSDTIVNNRSTAKLAYAYYLSHTNSTCIDEIKDRTYKPQNRMILM